MVSVAMRLSERFAYGLLALPLALIGLPLYVYLPTLFAQNTGLGLAAIGTVLLTARLVEAYETRKRVVTMIGDLARDKLADLDAPAPQLVARW